MDRLAFADRVFTEGDRLYSLSAAPGVRVYGEKLVESGGEEYREWDPRRSKLAAYLVNGGSFLPIRADSRVLYLGASSGTTPSHVSDIASKGTVYCVEFAQRMFRELVENCRGRSNMMPLLADATRPQEYSFMVEGADVVYADVAQKNQADILADNMDAFSARYGMVAVKARSEDVAAPPRAVFEKAGRRLRERGFRILDARSLEPWEDSHEMIVVERRRCLSIPWIRSMPWPSTTWAGFLWCGIRKETDGRCREDTSRRGKPAPRQRSASLQRRRDMT